MEAIFNFKDLTVEKIKQYVIDIKKDITDALDYIAADRKVRTFDDTVHPMIKVNTLIEPIYSCFQYASKLYADKKIRDGGAEAEKEIDNFLIECNFRRDVYNAFKEYKKSGYSEEKSQLTHEEMRYFEHIMCDFARNGLYLDNAESGKLKAMKKELSDLCNQYSRNLNEENTWFSFTRNELKGISESWFTKERILKSDGNESHFKVTLKYPDYFPVMRYVENEQIRRTVYSAFNMRCQKDNLPLFDRAVKLRYQIANILGYETWADYATEIKVIKNSKNAIDFEHDMNQRLDAVYHGEIYALTEFAKKYKLNPLNKPKLDLWDHDYYIRLYKEHICNVDLNEIQKFFPLKAVRNGLFKIFQTLLGLKFEQIDTNNRWHKSVEMFSVRDSKSNELLGYFYLDMYPRDGKYGHVAAFDFMSSCNMSKITGKSKRRPCIVTMVCNFPKEGTITFSNVETFFHEFGHVMHIICSRAEIYKFNGFKVEWDFIEAPSQMLEHWIYCKESLQLMSSHEQTSQPIPEEEIRKLKQMKNILMAIYYKKQILYGMYDLTVHTMKFSKNTVFDSTRVWSDTDMKIRGIVSSDKYCKQASFGHLMSGYSAGYYGYLLSQTYATHMFYRWFKDGHVLDPVVGMRYRKKLLEPGGGKDGLDLLKDFLGEEPDIKYFLIDNGFVDE